MAVMICEKHGRCNITVTSPQIFYDCSNNITKNNIIFVSVIANFLGYETSIYVDKGYVEEYNLPKDSPSIFILNDEDNEQNPEIKSKLRQFADSLMPICPKCLSEFIENSNASK